MVVDPQRLARIIDAQTDPEPFSGVVRLSAGDEVLFEASRGSAIRSENISNRVNTRFQMASGCKLFTSVAVCRLVEQGKLAFDTPLAECVDVTFPNHAPGITVSHLLTHTSGITSYFEEDVDPDYEKLWRDRPMYTIRGPRDFLPLFQDKPMKFAPGEQFDYNDGGFILLGLIVETVAGIRFQDYVQEHVFDRAGMTDSGYFATDRLPERTAYAYIKDDDGAWRTNFFAVPIIGAPDGGAYTTAPDMASFWRALDERRLLSDEMAAELLEPRVATGWKPPYTHYGYGVWIDRAGDTIRKYFVVGSDPGVALRSAVYAGGVTLTAIGNTEHALWPLVRELENALGL